MHRKYCFAARFPMEVSGYGDVDIAQPASTSVPSSEHFTSVHDLSNFLERLIRDAKRRSQENTIAAKFARSRQVVRRLFASLPLQIAVASLLVANFAANAFEAQMQGRLTLPDGSPTDVARFLEHADTFFTVIFAIELAFNIYAHWMHDFINDGW